MNVGLRAKNNENADQHIPWLKTQSYMNWFQELVDVAAVPAYIPSIVPTNIDATMKRYFSKGSWEIPTDDNTAQ